ACAQLNRAVETRPDRRPLMSDLRDSGEVEQDADIIAMLHRDEVYNANDPQWRGLAELIVRKQRNGPIGTCWLAYSAERMAFGSHDGAIPLLHESTKRRTGFDSE